MIDKRIEDLLPDHYRSYAPRFIKFIEKYYEWLYREPGLTESEIAYLRNDLSWIKNDLDKFIVTGDVKYLNPSDPGVVDKNIEVLNNTSNPGNLSVTMVDKFMMEESLEGYNTIDPTTGLYDIYAKDTVYNNIVSNNFKAMGFPRINRSPENPDNIDQILMASLLKHLYSFKGTFACIRLFFYLFFKEEVLVFYPKKYLAVVDENWIVDWDHVIRDDIRNQEYSYIITVKMSTSYYSDLFNEVYMRTLHPAGFRVELMTFDYTTNGVPLEQGGYLLVNENEYLAADYDLLTTQMLSAPLV